MNKGETYKEVLYNQEQTYYELYHRSPDGGRKPQ